MRPAFYHIPVLGDQVLSHVDGRRRGVDATAGGGGHVALLLEADMTVLAIDQDPEAIAALRQRWAAEVQIVPGGFHAPDVVSQVRSFAPDFILLDLGVSSRQLDEDTRGFTFRIGAPLDMRMSGAGPTAAMYLNRASHDELFHAFRVYGDERRARRLAREVERRRDNVPFATSDDLVNAVRAVLGPSSGRGDFARLFQAVRIAVNDEFVRLESALESFLDVMADGGRLAVITYHSGEDRIVKRAFRQWERACVCPPELPVCSCRGRARGKRINRKPIGPTEHEIAENSRARSAKLRVFERVDP